MNNKSDPMEMFKQVTNGYTPEQMEQLFNNARQFGIPDETLKQVQNGINANSVDIN